MIYECLVQHDTASFVVARTAGHPWTERELDEFDLVTLDAAPFPYDREVILYAECGEIPVMASQIDPALVTEAEA